MAKNNEAGTNTADSPQWVKVEGNDTPPEYGAFYQWEHIGERLTGVFVAKRKNPARVGEDGTRFKEQWLYDIKGESGDLWTVNGNFSLDSKMKKIRPGSLVRITYASDADAGNGLTPMRVFDVEQARGPK